MTTTHNSNLNYNPISGVFTWAATPRNGKGVAGQPAGHIRPDGNVYLRFNGKLMLAHHLAWELTYGESHKGHLEHIDGDKTNNAISNLRPLTQAPKVQKIVKWKDLPGHLGVKVSATGGGFYSEIDTGILKLHLGTYSTGEEAAAAYNGAKRMLESLQQTGFPKPHWLRQSCG